MAATEIRVMLVDDHAIMRDGLREVLEQSGDCSVVAQAADGVEALAIAERARPDLIIMDVIMPNKDGVEACREIMQRLPDTQVLILTSSTADDAIIEAAAAGAAGYLQKYSGRDDLLTAVREVAEGRSRIPFDIARRAFNAIRRAPPDSKNDKAAKLTIREREIVKLFSRGNSYRQVAEVVGNTPLTVRNAVYRIQDKIGVGSKQEMVVWAVRHGLLDDLEEDA